MADKLSRYILEKYLKQAETYNNYSTVLGKNSLRNKQSATQKNNLVFHLREDNNEEISLFKDENANVYGIKIKDEFFDAEDLINFKNFLNTLPKELLKRLQAKKSKRATSQKNQNKTPNIADEKYVIIDEKNLKPVLVKQETPKVLKERLEGEFKIVEDEQKPTKINVQDIKNEEFVIVDDDDDEENNFVITDMFEWNGEQYKVYEDVTKMFKISDCFLPGSSKEEVKVNHFMSKLITAVEREFNKQLNVPEKQKRDKSKDDEKDIAIAKRREESKERMQRLREKSQNNELDFEK